MTESRSIETDVTGMARDAGYSFTGQLVGYASTPVSALLITRILGAELYGLYAFLVYLEGLLANLSSFGMNNALTRFTARFIALNQPGRIGGLIKFALTALLSAAGLVFLVLAFFPEVPSLLTRFEVPPDFVRFYAVAVPLTVGYAALLAALKGWRGFREHTLSYSIAGSLTKISVLLMVFLTGLGFYAVLSANLLRNVVILLVAGFFVWRFLNRTKDTDRFSKENRSEVVKFSLSVYTANVLRKQAFDSDLLILAYFHNALEVGLYAVVSRLQPLIYTPQYVLMDIFGPVITALETQDRERLGLLYRTVSRWSFTLAIPMYLVFVFAGRDVLALFGDSFTGAYTALVVLASGGLVAAYTGISGQLILMAGHHQVNLMNSVLSFLVTVGLYLWLIPEHGFEGAAVASAVYLVFINSVRLVEVRVLFGYIHFEWKIMKPVAAAVSVSALVYLSAGIVAGMDPLIRLVFLALTITGSYLFLLWVFRWDETDRMVLDKLFSKLGRSSKR